MVNDDISEITGKQWYKYVAPILHAQFLAAIAANSLLTYIKDPGVTIDIDRVKEYIRRSLMRLLFV